MNTPADNDKNDGSKPDECALITELLSRRAAKPLALLAIKAGLSANAVTILAGLAWMCSLVTAPLAGMSVSRGTGCETGYILWLVSGFLWNAGYILDVADGSIARMTGTASRRGFYLDYVFHLLFKPAFLASLGVGLYFCGLENDPENLMLLILGVLSVPANWSASSSAVEHVLCEETGKGRINSAVEAGSPGFRRLWLGTTDMNDTAKSKKTSAASALTSLAKEIFSYYAQFVFFSVTVLADLLVHSATGNHAMPFTRWSYIAITSLLIIRIPIRVIREYRRISASDPK